MKKAIATQKLNQKTRDFEKALKDAENNTYILRLYVAGLTRKSKKAIENAQRICDENLQGRYKLEIVDIAENPRLALVEQIFATPTLIKKLPLPLRRLIGDMSDTAKFLLGIDFQRNKK
jgi:circadian clock protein KaiB